MPAKPRSNAAPEDDAFAESTPAPGKPLDVESSSDKVTEDEDGEYQVVTQHDNNVVFSGSEADARAYMEANFPRPHIELGRVKYPAQLVAPSGAAEIFHVSEGWSNA